MQLVWLFFIKFSNVSFHLTFRLSINNVACSCWFLQPFHKKKKTWLIIYILSLGRCVISIGIAGKRVDRVSEFDWFRRRDWGLSLRAPQHLQTWHVVVGAFDLFWSRVIERANGTNPRVNRRRRQPTQRRLSFTCTGKSVLLIKEEEMAIGERDGERKKWKLVLSVVRRERTWKRLYNFIFN